MKNFKNKLKSSFKKFIWSLKSKDHKALVLIANQSLKQNLTLEAKTINEVEFHVFSQFGEDGIIQYPTNRIDIPNPVFVEFGVEDYT
jgi:N12 class adenine-specific DNA methylase